MNKRVVGLEDTRFVLFDQLGVEKLFSYDRVSGHSRETFEMILQAAEKLAVNEFAPTNKLGDKDGCTWKDNVVKVPESFHKPFLKYVEGGDGLPCPKLKMWGGKMRPIHCILLVVNCFTPQICPSKYTLGIHTARQG